MFKRRWRFPVSDGFSFGFLITAVVSVFLFELFVVLSVVEEGFLPLSIHVILGTFVFINILSNLSMVMLKDTTTKRIILPSLLKPQWTFCSACEANAPPRSFHCDKCKACILKRDHHCAFACCCIGLKNYRFFMAFLLYLSIGCLYATVFNMYFIWEVLGGFSLFSLAAHIVPFLFWVLGYFSFKVFIYTTLSVLALVGFLFVTNLFIFHAQQLLHNQTTFEKTQGIRAYDLGWRNNLVECLGINWYYAWLCPLIRSPLPSDGLSFNVPQNFNTSPRTMLTGGNVRHRNL